MKTLDSYVEKFKVQDVKELKELFGDQKAKEVQTDVDSVMPVLISAIQKFKGLTSDKDNASIYLLKHLVDRFRNSVESR